MRRFLAIGLSTIVLVVMVSQVIRSAPGVPVDREELRGSTGGDTGKVPCTKRCDALGPIPYFVDCASQGGVCKACLDANFQPTMGDGICDGYQRPGKKFGGVQICGDKFEGNCVWNGAKFVCVGSFVGFPCTADGVVTQTVIDPGYQAPE